MKGVIYLSTFGKILRELRKNEKLTQTELAKKLGLAFSTISMYERGDREPDFETMEAIADYFNVSMDYLHGKKVHKSGLYMPSPSVAEDFETFPVIGDIAAGFDSIAVENWTGDKIEIPVSFLKGHPKTDYFVLCVKGDSMYPEYHEGDKVLILKQSALEHSGQIGAVLYDDEYATLKRVEYIKGEDWLKLVPINPNVPPKKIEGEQLNHCRILGIPKMLIRDIG